MGQIARSTIMHWVAREVLVHEPALRSWLRKMADANDVEDVVQESYCRISHLQDVSHIRNGRAYLFTTAKSIMLERIRRSRVVSIETVAEIENLQVACNSASPEEIAIQRDQLQFVTRVINSFPERCRRIFQLRKVDGLSQREVAMRMGVAEHTVENDVAKGLRLIHRAIAEDEEESRAFSESIAKNEGRRFSTGGR